MVFTSPGDLVVESRGVELDLLTQLLQRLRVLEPRLRCAAQRLAELDVLLAYTAAAVKHRWAPWRKSGRWGFHGGSPKIDGL